MIVRVTWEHNLNFNAIRELLGPYSRLSFKLAQIQSRVNFAKMTEKEDMEL